MWQEMSLRTLGMYGNAVASTYLLNQKLGPLLLPLVLCIHPIMWGVRLLLVTLVSLPYIPSVLSDISSMSKYIQPISHYPQHKRIKSFLIKKYWNNSHSNLTEASAEFTRLESVPKNYVTYFWCIRGPSHYWAVLKNRYFRPCYKEAALAWTNNRTRTNLVGIRACAFRQSTWNWKDFLEGEKPSKVGELSEIQSKVRRLETLQKTSRQKIGKSPSLKQRSILQLPIWKTSQGRTAGCEYRTMHWTEGPVGTTSSLAVLKLLSAPAYGDRRCILHRCHLPAENTDTMIAQEPSLSLTQTHPLWKSTWFLTPFLTWGSLFYQP